MIFCEMTYYFSHFYCIFEYLIATGKMKAALNASLKKKVCKNASLKKIIIIIYGS